MAVCLTSMLTHASTPLACARRHVFPATSLRRLRRCYALWPSSTLMRASTPLACSHASRQPTHASAFQVTATPWPAAPLTATTLSSRRRDVARERPGSRGWGSRGWEPRDRRSSVGGGLCSQYLSHGMLGCATQMPAETIGHVWRMRIHMVDGRFAMWSDPRVSQLDPKVFSGSLFGWWVCGSCCTLLRAKVAASCRSMVGHGPWTLGRMCRLCAEDRRGSSTALLAHRGIECCFVACFVWHAHNLQRPQVLSFPNAHRED